MTYQLPELPYALNALEPHISKRTMSIHHGKHHKSYVDKLNAAIEGRAYDGEPLTKVIQYASEAGEVDVFNNAAQAWNHALFWNSMTPDKPLTPRGALAELIDKNFGGLPQLRSEFVSTGTKHFGSGWVWLVLTEKGDLEVHSTVNADQPTINGNKPLLTCDVWEHAYYLDYQNMRQEFLEVFFDELVNWEFASDCLIGKLNMDTLAAKPA